MYRHSPYQAAVAALIASIPKNFTVVTMPTGSGKTWVQGILSKYYCNKGQTITIIEPTEALKL
jgi:superfamily II DNA or RNA helicase